MNPFKAIKLSKIVKKSFVIVEEDIVFFRRNIDEKERKFLFDELKVKRSTRGRM